GGDANDGITRRRMSELCIRRSLALRMGWNLNTCKNLVFFQCRGHHASKECGGVESASAVRTDRSQLRVKRNEHGGQIRSRIRMGNIPADRPAVPNGRIADSGCSLCEDTAGFLKLG